MDAHQPTLFEQDATPVQPEQPISNAEFAARVAAAAPRNPYSEQERRQAAITELRGEDLAAEQTGAITPVDNDFTVQDTLEAARRVIEEQKAKQPPKSDLEDRIMARRRERIRNETEQQ